MVILEKYLTKNPCYKANVNVADSRYRVFQQRGPLGLMLHSVGCAQPSAEAFWKRWNNANYDRACVHAFIDAQTGDIWKTLPWNFRAWHCGGSGNNTHIGVEMCESKWISYYNGWQFEIIDRAKAVEDCRRAYNSAVELFAFICSLYGLDPATAILSHKEGHQKGIASDHGDPEHYWKGLGMSYTMNTFRAAVQSKMEDYDNMIRDEIHSIVQEEVAAAIGPAIAQLTQATTDNITNAIDAIMGNISGQITEAIELRTGRKAHDITNVMKSIRPRIQKLIDAGVINGGTPAEENPTDVNMYGEDLRVLAILSMYIDQRIEEVENKILIKSE